MFVTRSATGALVWAPAKLNLFLEVLGQRGDGFHDVETLLVPVTLWDRLELHTTADGAIDVDCRWASGADRLTGVYGELPPPAENLVTRALRLVRAEAGVEAGARVRLEKRIPAAAGLGGGSSDAAAALLAANVAWRLHWPHERLVAVAAQLGSDVPFFLLRGPAIGRGRGERLEPVAGLGVLHAVVVRPPFGLSTAAVYRACRPATAPRAVGGAVAALRRRDWRRVEATLHNRLEPAAIHCQPRVAGLRSGLLAAGCPVAQLTGSGSACFGLCRHAGHARQVAGRLAARGHAVWAVRSLAGMN